MSKAGMIGSVARALPGIRGRHLGLVRDLTYKLGGKHADAVHRTVADALVKNPIPAVLVRITQVRLNELRTATVFENRENESVPGMFQEILRLPPGMPPDVIAALLKSRKHALTEMQAKWLLDKQDKLLRGEHGGEDVGLRAEAVPNFIPVANSRGGCALWIARHGAGKWHHYPHSFDEDTIYLAGAHVVVGDRAASRS